VRSGIWTRIDTSFSPGGVAGSVGAGLGVGVGDGVTGGVVGEGVGELVEEGVGEGCPGLVSPPLQPVSTATDSRTVVVMAAVRTTAPR
jgi:hypothetical protein